MPFNCAPEVKLVLFKSKRQDKPLKLLSNCFCTNFFKVLPHKHHLLLHEHQKESPNAPLIFYKVILPILIVACLLMTSGERGVNLVTSCTREILEFIHLVYKCLES